MPAELPASSLLMKREVGWGRNSTRQVFGVGAEAGVHVGAELRAFLGTVRAFHVWEAPFEGLGMWG